MAMEISRSYNPSKSDEAERMKEKQALERAEKAKEAKQALNGGKVSGKAQEPQDEYISREKSGAKPTGLYWLGEDENGNRKIFYDDPKKSKSAETKDGDGSRKIFFDDPKKSDRSDGKEASKAKEGQPEKDVKKGSVDTSKVDQEIKRLREKKQQLEQQIRSASGDSEKIRGLEKKLAQVENELRQKDNDAYKKRNASVSW